MRLIRRERLTATWRILQPCVPLQYRWCLPSAHVAPSWSKGMRPWPLGTLPPSGSMHQWFPAVGLPVLRLAFQKGHLAGKTWWAQLGSNQ